MSHIVTQDFRICHLSFLLCNPSLPLSSPRTCFSNFGYEKGASLVIAGLGNSCWGAAHFLGVPLSKLNKGCETLAGKGGTLLQQYWVLFSSALQYGGKSSQGGGTHVLNILHHCPGQLIKVQFKQVQCDYWQYDLCKWCLLTVGELEPSLSFARHRLLWKQNLFFFLMSTKLNVESWKMQLDQDVPSANFSYQRAVRCVCLKTRGENGPVVIKLPTWWHTNSTDKKHSKTPSALTTPPIKWLQSLMFVIKKSKYTSAVFSSLKIGGFLNKRVFFLLCDLD